ncbi:MAG: DNA-directed RNA polymerase subunit alpha [Chloroflexi bacterium]|nr:DNA-directed RNA polymerase subunit alpha [Chloroflexota bacterium]
MSHLILPKVECTESTDTFGRFVAEPLEKGFGVTLGNAMRRTLFGFLQGAAVTWVKIDEVTHEFAPIPHAKEDAMDFLLNLKSLRLKPVTSRAGKMTLRVEREGQVTAADIETTTDFEITNPDLYLATLNSVEGTLHVEFNVELGKGYRQAQSGDSLPVGAIPVDAIFTPVRKVNFTVEPMHVGRETSYERLVLEVWTDRTISPMDAVSQSANLLIEQLMPFVKEATVFLKKPEEQPRVLPIPEEKHNIPVQQLDLSVRTMNCLRRAGITTVGELVSRTEKELLSLRNFGQKSKREIEARLTELGLSLARGVEEEAGVPKAETIEEEIEEEPESETESE